MREHSPVRRHRDICGGQLTLRGTRVLADSLVGWLQEGGDLDSWLENYPSVPREQAIAALGAMLAALEAATPLEEA